MSLCRGDDRTARSYDPELRTWVTADEYDAPVDDLDLAMDPLSVGRLGYASADPVNNTDEDGHRIDYCQGMCISSTTGKAYQSYGYAGYGGSKVQVHTQTYGNTCYGVCAVRLAQQRAAAAMAATRARWLAAKAQRERKLEKIRAQRAARAAALNQKCKKNPFQPDCGRWRGQHCTHRMNPCQKPATWPLNKGNMIVHGAHTATSAITGVLTSEAGSKVGSIIGGPASGLATIAQCAAQGGHSPGHCVAAGVGSAVGTVAAASGCVATGVGTVVVAGCAVGGSIAGSEIGGGIYDKVT